MAEYSTRCSSGHERQRRFHERAFSRRGTRLHQHRQRRIQHAARRPPDKPPACWFLRPPPRSARSRPECDRASGDRVTAPGRPLFPRRRERDLGVLRAPAPCLICSSCSSSSFSSTWPRSCRMTSSFTPSSSAACLTNTRALPGGVQIEACRRGSRSRPCGSRPRPAG